MYMVSRFVVGGLLAKVLLLHDPIAFAVTPPAYVVIPYIQSKLYVKPVNLYILLTESRILVDEPRIYRM